MQRIEAIDLAEMFGPDGLGNDGTVEPVAGDPVPVTVHIRAPQEIAEGIVGTGGVAPVNTAEALIPAEQLAGVEPRGGRLVVPALGFSYEIVKPIERAFGMVTRLQIRNRLAI